MNRTQCSRCHEKYEEPRTASYCKPCWNAYHAKRREDPVRAQAARDATNRWLAAPGNLEKLRARERERDRAERRAAGVPEKPHYTPEEALAAAKVRQKRYRADPEKRARELATTRVYQRKMRGQNPEHVRALDRARYVRDREKRITASLKMRAKRAGAPGSHTVAEWKAVLRHHKRKCAYCSTKLTPKNVSRDHVLPLSRGGTNDIRNIVPACRLCNSKKHARTLEEFKQR